MNNNSEENIKQLQIFEQSLQQLMAQKQNFQMQLLEAEKAIESLQETSEAYKIIGNIMVLSDKAKLKEELTEKKETFELRIKALDRQETTTRDKANALQKEVMEAMENDNKNS